MFIGLDLLHISGLEHAQFSAKHMPALRNVVPCPYLHAEKTSPTFGKLIVACGAWMLFGPWGSLSKDMSLKKTMPDVGSGTAIKPHFYLMCIASI